MYRGDSNPNCGSANSEDEFLSVVKLDTWGNIMVRILLVVSLVKQNECNSWTQSIYYNAYIIFDE